MTALILTEDEVDVPTEMTTYGKSSCSTVLSIKAPVELRRIAECKRAGGGTRGAVFLVGEAGTGEPARASFLVMDTQI